MKKNSILFLSLSLISLSFFNACEDQNSDFDLEEYPVVEAYLYHGQPVDRIKVFKISDFKETANENNTISGLQISLKVDSVQYLLSEKEDEPGSYFYAGNNFQLEPGMFCALEFEYNNLIISSETTIPESPQNLELSKESLGVSMGGWGGGGVEPIEVTWDNPSNDYFYMVATNIEDNPTPVNEEMEDLDDPPLSVGTQPTTSNLLNIMPQMCRYYGTYEMVIFRVNPEFAELSLYTTTSTINLTEPYTNIKNGKGLFTAFASDTAYFEAVSYAK